MVAGVTGYHQMSWNVTGAEYQLNHWYLVDVELDESLHPEILDDTAPPTIGEGAMLNGVEAVVVRGVANPLGPNWTEADINGVGWIYPWGEHGIVTQWRWRNEYGDERWVLRAIYQVHPDSWAVADQNGASHLHQFQLQFYNFDNGDGIHVSKVITRDITWNSYTVEVEKRVW